VLRVYGLLFPGSVFRISRSILQNPSLLYSSRGNYRSPFSSKVCNLSFPYTPLKLPLLIQIYPPSVIISTAILCEVPSSNNIGNRSADEHSPNISCSARWKSTKR
jgi:hypothetical protein